MAKAYFCTKKKKSIEQQEVFRWCEIVLVSAVTQELLWSGALWPL